MKTVVVLGSFLAVVLAGRVAAADLTARCATGRIASLGDRSWEVRGACGAPDQADRRVIVRTLRERSADYALVAAVTVSVTIDEWVYDDGPDRLIRIFTFEDGRLVRIQTRGFGLRR